MTVVGDCHTEGTVRVEGTVEGSIAAGKAVVVGKGGNVVGDILTKDAVISGRVSGSVVAESRLEVQATSRIDGDIQSKRMQLEEGAVFNGTVKMGDFEGGKVPTARPEAEGLASRPEAEGRPSRPEAEGPPSRREAKHRRKNRR